MKTSVWIPSTKVPINKLLLAKTSFNQAFNHVTSCKWILIDQNCKKMQLKNFPPVAFFQLRQSYKWSSTIESSTIWRFWKEKFVVFFSQCKVVHDPERHKNFSSWSCVTLKLCPQNYRLHYVHLSTNPQFLILEAFWVSLTLVSRFSLKMRNKSSKNYYSTIIMLTFTIKVG